MYQAVYKCRLCSEKFSDEHYTEDENVAAAVAVALSVNENSQHVRFPYTFHKYRMHYCKDGSYGFSDFQGFKKVEE